MAFTKKLPNTPESERNQKKFFDRTAEPSNYIRVFKGKNYMVKFCTFKDYFYFCR